MAVIWGLDLKDMQWSKFKGGYMWNNEYHLRRTKFIVYQLAMILCVVSESLGTDVLSDYVSEQKYVQRYGTTLGTDINIKNNDIVGAFSYNIFVGVFVATIFGAAFFFDLFWPDRHESLSVRIAWKACSILACIFALSSAICLTVILATKRAVLVGDTTGLELKLKSPLTYKDNGEAIASVVLLWLGWIATCAATGLMFASINHIEHYDSAKAGHLRSAEARGSGSLRGSRSGSRPVSAPSYKHEADSEKEGEQV